MGILLDSRSVTLETLLAGDTPPSGARFQQIGSFQRNDQPAQPIQASIAVKSAANDIPGPMYGGAGSGLTFSTSYEFYAGQYAIFGEDNLSACPPLGGGLLRWRVTRGGYEDWWYTDMRPGLFHLGVCDNVFVDALRWRAESTIEADFGAVEVSCGLSVATQSGAEYDEFTYTIESYVDAGTLLEQAPYWRPPRARWFTPYVSTRDNTAFLQSTDTIIFNPGSPASGGSFAMGEQVIFSGPDGAVIPTKHRYEVGGANTYLLFSSLEALSQDILVGVRFWLAH